MGQELACTIQYGDQKSAGKAYLETNEILFRGDFRLKIPLQSVTDLEAHDGCLCLRYEKQPVVLELGAHAAKWREKILNPKSRLDKIGVKAGMRVAVVDVADRELPSELADRKAVLLPAPDTEADIVLIGLAQREHLDRLRGLEHRSEGAVWVIYPKGVKTITEAEVMAAGKAAGYVDVKICSFSPTHTGLKIVIPVAKRPARAPQKTKRTAT